MYHLLSESFLEIDSELKECLINGTIENIPSDIKSLLAEKGFLVEQDRNEVESIRYADIVKRYQSKLMRLTILPTINCNFRCWYCYETHKYSRMSKEQANCIFEFLKKENNRNALLVDYQYYTLKTVEKWQNRFCVDTKNVRFNVFNFWLHQNHIDMDWMGAFEPTP